MAVGGHLDAHISECASNDDDHDEEDVENDERVGDLQYSNTRVELSAIYAKKKDTGINHINSVEQGCGPSRFYYGARNTEMPLTGDERSVRGLMQIPQITIQDIMQTQTNFQTMQNNCGSSTWIAPEPVQQQGTHGRTKRRRLVENLRKGGFAALKIKEHIRNRRLPWDRLSRLLHLKETYANYLRRGGSHEVLEESDRVKSLITKQVEGDPAVWKLYL